MLKSWKKNIWANIRELKADNKKSGKGKGAEWKVRPMKQVIAIALNVALKPKKEMKHEKKETKKTEKKEHKNTKYKY